MPDVYFTSALRRAQHTLDLILDEMGIVDVTITRNKALNERDYGDLAGLNKDDAREKWGEEQVLIWRRSYDVPPPGGESLKDTAARTLPYYEAEIVPLVKAGKTVLIAAHGNSLRSHRDGDRGADAGEILKRETRHRRAGGLPDRGGREAGGDGGGLARLPAHAPAALPGGRGAGARPAATSTSPCGERAHPVTVAKVLSHHPALPARGWRACAARPSGSR